MESEQRFSSYYTAESARITDSIDKAVSNPYLLENISNHYVFEEEVHMSFNILRKYENLIRANVISVPMESKWKYKPEYCSYDYYGTTDFWYLVMFVNNIYNPLQFNMDTVLLVEDIFISEVFKNVISKEINMRNSLKAPNMIYKHILKDLNSPSKQVLPSDFDDKLDGLVNPVEYERRDEILDLSNYYANSELMINGILKTSFKKGLTANKERPVYKNYYYNANYEDIDYYGDENYYPGGYIDTLGQSKETLISITKEGKLKVNRTGEYKFKILSCGNFALYINDKNIINTTSPNFLTKNENLNIFEDYSLNADFKRRNLEYWVTGKRAGLSRKSIKDTTVRNSEDLIIYDDYLNKEVLAVNCDEQLYLYGHKYKKLDTNNLACSMEVPISSANDFENDGDLVFIVDYDILGQHPKDKKKGRYNHFYAKIVVTNKNNVKTEIIKRTSSEFKEFPIITDATSKESYYKKPMKEVFIVGKDEIPAKDNIKSISMSLHIGEFSSSSKNALESIPKMQYAISKFSLITLDLDTGNSKSIHLDKDVWYNFETVLTKEYYDIDFFYFKYTYGSEPKFRTPPRYWFWYPFSVLSTPNGEYTVNGIPYHRKPYGWSSDMTDSHGYLDSKKLNATYAHMMNMNNMAFPMMFELTILDVTNDDKGIILRQMLIDHINMNEVNIIDEFGLESNKDYKFIFRIPHIYYSPISNRKEILIQNMYNEGTYMGEPYTKDWYLTSTDITGTYSIMSNKNTRVNVYKIEEYSEQLALGQYYTKSKLLGSNNKQENVVNFTVEANDIYVPQPHQSPSIKCDLLIEVMITRGSILLDYDISVLMNEYKEFDGYANGIDSIFKYMTTLDRNTLSSKNINNPAYVLDYPITLPLAYNSTTYIDNSNKEVKPDGNIFMIYPYIPSYNSIYKLINPKFTRKDIEEVINQDAIDASIVRINSLRNTLEEMLLSDKYSDIMKQFMELYIQSSLCTTYFLSKLLEITEVIHNVMDRFDSDTTEEYWIYHIDFNALPNTSHGIDYIDNSNLVRMKGVFGLYIDYIDNNSSYLLLWNFDKNTDFLQSGLYKYDGSFEKLKIRQDMTYDTFREKLKLLKAIPELTSESYIHTPDSKKNFIVMKQKDYILIRKDNSRYPFFTFSELKEDKKAIPLRNGNVGYFAYQVENFNYVVKLYK